jgi:hypothetical protein
MIADAVVLADIRPTLVRQALFEVVLELEIAPY